MIVQEPVQAAIWHCLNHYAYHDATFLAERLYSEVENDDTLFTLATCYYRQNQLHQAYYILHKKGSKSPKCKYLMAKCAFELKNLSGTVQNKMETNKSDSDNRRKPRRGRPPNTPIEERETLFMEKLSEIVVDGKLIECTEPIYFEMAKSLSLNKQTVYLAAKRFVEKNKLIPNSNKDPEVDDEYIPLKFFDEGFVVSSNDICFDIDISNIGLFDESIEAMTRSLEWSHTITEIIWEFSRLPCSWRFSRMKKVCNELVFSARCKSLECSKLSAFTENDGSKLKIVIKAFNDQCAHLKKLSTKYVRKEKVDELLKLNSANVVRAKLADDYMNEHEEFAEALRMQKYRFNKTEYLHPNPTIAIRKMKELNRYFGSIMDIGMDPFFVMYATPLQIELLRVYTRYGICIISFDSSGAPVIPPEFSSYSIEHDKLKPVFIYTINLQLPTFSIPIFQLLSQRHKSNFLHNLLSCWQDECFGGKNPNEVIVDDSSALLLAMVKTFTSCTTMERYLNDCYDALFNGSDPPECFIRLDRSHFIKSIKNNEQLKNEDKRRKLLYQRLLGYLVTVEDVAIAEKVIREMFILINNKYLNDEYVSNAKKSLKSVSDFHLMDGPESEDDKIFIPTEFDSELFGSSKFKIWLNDISEDVAQNFVNHELNSSMQLDVSDDDRLQDNLYYAPQLQKHLMNILMKLPLFSNILMKTFNSKNKTATSSPTEVGFNFIKNNLFNHATRMRADTFVQKHIEYLLGNIKVYSTTKYTEAAVEKSTVESSIESSSALNTKIYEEKWKNKNLDIKSKPKRQKRCQNSLLNPLPPSKRRLPILKNGERIIGTKTTIGSLLTSTCTFDSIFQVYAALYADSQIFKDKIDADTSKFSTMLRTSFNDVDHAMRLRSEILLDVFKEDVIDYGKNILALSCYMSINRMFIHLSTNFPILQSYVQTKQCVDCLDQSKDGKSFIPINLTSINLKSLQDAIVFSSKTCSKCKKPFTVSYKKNEMIVLDVEVLDQHSKHTPIKLDDISENICIEADKYALKGVVEFISSHFIAHVRRNDSAFESYDDLKPSRLGKSPKYELNAVLLFYNTTIESLDPDNIHVQTDANDRPNGIDPVELDQPDTGVGDTTIESLNPDNIHVHTDANDRTNGIDPVELDQPDIGAVGAASIGDRPGNTKNTDDVNRGKRQRRTPAHLHNFVCKTKRGKID